MAELKTKPNDQSVVLFLNSIENERKKKDAFTIHEMMREVTGEEPVMWGDSIVGYGNYHYKYKSGREGDWFVTGFSPRKQSLTIYTMGGKKEMDELFAQLGKHKTSVGCLYINKLDDVDLGVLRQIIEQGVENVKTTYPS